MSFTSLSRILIFAWQSFRRNIWLSVVTITVIILAFISINFLVVINIATDAAVKIVHDKIDVSIYFLPDTTEGDVLETQTFLSGLTQVDSIEYIPQAVALEIFRANHANDLEILESLNELTENPLGSTLIIRAKDPTAYPGIIEELEGSRYNDFILSKNFDDNRVFIERINEVSGNVSRIGIFTTGLFVIIALLIIFNTIRVAIYTHRKEIGIMKLVGATNWFISSPFLLESLFYGLVSAALGITIVYGLIGLLQPYINTFFQTNQVNVIEHFNANFWQIFGLEVLTISLISILGSAIAVRRYLKV